jgi:hypothetical protein
MATVIADYKEQRSAFDALCAPVCENRILFFEGESGSGKTILLRDCQRRIPAEVQHIGFECKGRTISVAEIFSRSVRRLGWEGLSEFRESVSTLSKGLTVNVHDIEQRGDQNTIDMVLRAESEDEKKNRQTMLTEAWFRDVRKRDDALLIIVDTFEQAGSALNDWFCGPFLARIPETPQARVLVAGQKIPEPNNIEWGDCCQHYQLLGVDDAQEWMPVVEAMNRYINVPNLDPMSWLAGVCHALEGRPDAIKKVIENLPEREKA